jgi:hypothetical protein
VAVTEQESAQETSHETREYRVTLPIDLGDGVVHYPGEELALNLLQATAYKHALLRLAQEEEKA